MQRYFATLLRRLRAGLIPILGATTVLALSHVAGAQEAVINTNRPFAAGAVEREQELRGVTGWTTYQEGVADGLTYRFDPDGYARFSRDDRDDADAWEVVCQSWPSVDCQAKRGDVTARLTDVLDVQVEVERELPSARWFLDQPMGEARMLPDLFAGKDLSDLQDVQMLLPEHGGPAQPIDGLATVARYMGWVQRRGEVLPEPLPPALSALPPPPPPADLPEPIAERAEPTADVVAPAPNRIEAPADTAVAAPVPVELTADVTAPVPERVEQATDAVVPVPAPPPPLPAAPVPSPPIDPPHSLAPTPISQPAIARAARPAARRSTATASPLPRCPIPPRPSDQPLGDSIDSLRGLAGVAIFTDYLTEPDSLKGQFRLQVRARVEERLHSVGLRLLDERELAREPGRPRLEFYLTRGDRAKDCPFRVAITLRQEVVLGRDTPGYLYTGTWSETGPSKLGFTENAEIETVAFYLESFIIDWRAANSGKPREEHRPIPRPKHEPTWGDWVERAFSMSVATSVPLKSGEDETREDGPSGVGQGSEPPSTPTFSTSLNFSWPDTPLFARFTVYKYLDPSRQQPWNPDFAYAFGYDDYRPNTFSLTYGNYGGNRFDPEDGEHFTQFEEGSIRAAYKLEFEDRLLAPHFTDEMRLFQCDPAITTVPRYFDESSNQDKSFKTALSFGCRYNIWRNFYVDGTAYFYPDPDQQQEWDPDYTYSFGWSNWRSGSFSLEYSNGSGNRWPWRDSGNGGFLEGAVTLSYRVPVGDIIDWFGRPVLPP